MFPKWSLVSKNKWSVRKRRGRGLPDPSAVGTLTYFLVPSHIHCQWLPAQAQAVAAAGRNTVSSSFLHISPLQEGRLAHLGTAVTMKALERFNSAMC